MQLILSRQSEKEGVVIEYSQPSIESSSKIKRILSNIIESNSQNGCFEDIIIAEDANFVNFIFEVPSEQSPNGCEVLMITAILDEQENPKIFEVDFKNTVAQIKKISSISRAFEKAEPPLNFKTVEANRKIGMIMNQLRNTLINKMKGKEKLGLAQIIFFGVEAVGKTTIIKRLITGVFQEDTAPTLAPQVLKLVFEQMSMRVYDVGGQKRLRHRWTHVLSHPNAIIYVIDSAGDEEKHEDSESEFNRILRFYYRGTSKSKKNKPIPLLILANKMDLNDSMSPDLVEDIYNPSEYTDNYRIFQVSAKTGQNLLQAFQWLSKKIKLFI